MDFLTSEITPIKVRGNNVDYSTIEITWKKVRGNTVNFSTIEIISKKIRGNNMNFSTSKITSKKVLENEVDFLISKIISKKYVEMAWKLVEIWSSTYRRNIDFESTWIRRVFPVGQDYSKINLFELVIYTKKNLQHLKCRCLLSSVTILILL